MSLATAVSGYVVLDFLSPFFERPEFIWLLLPGALLILLAMKYKKRSDLKPREFKQLMRFRKFVLAFKLLMLFFLVLELVVLS
mgnify:CR=1 FL=1